MAIKQKKYTAKTAEEKQKEIEELSNKMTNQLSSYFVSEDALKEHLAFMSIFYNYSLRNMALIQNQFRGASAVGSFKFWQDKGASVKKGEKGIQIFVPTPVTYFNRGGEWIQVQYADPREKIQIKNGALETQQKLFFKIGHVFEYTQTDAREKGMPVSKIFGQYYQDGVIENQDELLVAMHKVSKNLGFEILSQPPRELGTAKGVAYPNEKKIALNPRNTAYENVTTLLHELAHARLHTPDVRDSFTKAEREFQAEMVSYVVASRYGIDTENFSLSYLARWTQQGKELKDKEMLLNGVRTAACEFIEIIDAHFQEIEHSKEVNEPTQSAQEQELQEKPTESIYYSIDEEAARRAKEANSFSDYLPGSATKNYRQSIDAAIKIAERQKLQVDASFHDKIDGLLDTYARKLAENLNKSFEINARVPSMMITGGGNYPTKKKEKQNIARDKNMEEWRAIQGLLAIIQSTGRGGISSDDPEVVQKLEAKIVKLEAWQEKMKATNAFYRKYKTLDDCPHLSKSEVENLKVNMSSSWRSEPKPFESYQLTNNNAEIRRLKKRIQTLITSKEKDYGGWVFEGGKVEANKEENRLRIYFDERPNEQIRNELKSHGFRWSPKASAWQRQLTDNAVRVAQSMACLQPTDEKKLQNKEQEATSRSNWLLVEYGSLSNAKLRIIPEDDLLNEVAMLTRGQIEHEKLLAFSQVNKEFVQLFNDTFQTQFTLVNEQMAKTPQILIQWSESELKSNELMGFAEGNDRMAQLEEKVFHDKEKAYGYLKTRYHVLIPNGDKIDLVNPDRLDIGDGYYSSPYQQLLVENKLTEQQHQELLMDLALYSNECEKLINEQLSTLRSLHYWRRNQLVAEREEDHAEVEKSNQSIRYQLEQADQLNIPFKLQNKVLHHAEHQQYENFSDMRINEILSASHFDERGNKISKSSIIPKVDKARKSKEYER